MKGLIIAASVVIAAFSVTAGKKLASPDTGTLRTLYCLGDIERFQDFENQAVVDLISRGMPNGAEAIRENSDALGDKSRRMRLTLSHLGIRGAAIVQDRSYLDGRQSARACLADQANPCVQACYTARQGLTEDCERLCGLPQNCKPKYDCDFSPVAMN